MNDVAESDGGPVEILRREGKGTVVRLPADAYAGSPVPIVPSVVAEAGPDHVDLLVSPALRLNIAARHRLLSKPRNLAAASLIAAERDQFLWDVDVALALGANPSDSSVKEWRAANGVPKPPASWPSEWSPSEEVLERARALASGVPLADRQAGHPAPKSNPTPLAQPKLGGLDPGDVLGGYRIEHVLGRGGMGVVYSAFEDNLNRRIALKVITPHVADDAETRQRFVREARTAASIEHPHAVPIHAIGESQGLLYIAMRQISGSTLHTVIEREVFLEPARALRIVSQIAGVLDAAHEAGVVHRDVKPQNILLGSHSRLEHAYLSDFGLARLMQDTGLTRTGESLGTPSYMAPEQVRGDKVITSAADIYSLGCVLYECLTGVTPFERDSPHAVMFAHLNDEPPKASAVNSQAPSSVDPLIERALAKDPTARFETAGALATALGEVLLLETLEPTKTPDQGAKPQNLPVEGRSVSVEEVSSRRTEFYVAGRMWVTGAAGTRCYQDLVAQLGERRALDVVEMAPGLMDRALAINPTARHPQLRSGEQPVIVEALLLAVGVPDEQTIELARVYRSRSGATVDLTKYADEGLRTEIGIEATAYLTELIGQTLYTVSGRENWVIGIEGDYVIVGTDPSPHGQRVPIATVQSALHELQRSGEVRINTDAVGYRSAFVGAVLLSVPGAVSLRNPARVQLRRVGSGR